MRFVFVTTMDGEPWGGSEGLWSQAALRLHGEGHEVAASVVWWPTPSPKVLALKEKGIHIHFRKRPQKNGLIPRILRKIGRRLVASDEDTSWLRARRPDLVVISQGGFTDGAGWMQLCRKERAPFVAIAHCNSENWWPRDTFAATLAEAYSGARKIFGVSRHNIELLRDQLGGDLPEFKLVWNPCNLQADTQPSWPSTNEVWRIACVARLDPVAKGQDLLFHALAHPQWRARPIEINLYGGGVCDLGLRRLAKKLQLTNVHFRGHLSNVNGIWEQNHLLILPSRFEGLPIALVEATLCGRPALVTDVGGNTELCVDGETGFVATAPGVRDIEQALERAWASRADWQAMGAKARIMAEELIPKDPVGDFCQQLLTCAAGEMPRP
jgi:glycosyltransferase involved in cell wall biosynthesis